MNDYTIPAAFIAKALSRFQPEGDLKNQTLKKHHINPAWIELRDKRVSSRDVANLLQECMILMDDEQLGHADAPQPLGTWATMAQLAIGAESLGEALNRIARFYRIVPWAINTRLDIEGDTARFIMCAESRHSFSPYLYESFLFYVLKFSSWLINQAIPLTEVAFCFPEPWYYNEFQILFSIDEMVFESGDSHLSFRKSLLNEPLLQDQYSLRKFLSHYNLSILAQHNRNESWRRKVEKALTDRLTTHVGIATISKALGVHHHTLRKHLDSEGVQFNEVRDLLRRDIALKMLLQNHLSIEAIGLSLGYSETSVFSRAFKRWFGVSPSHYRQQVLYSENKAFSD